MNTEETKVQEPKKHGVNTCFHDWKPNPYWSLTISLPYDHIKTSFTKTYKEVSIFGMQREDMINLAHSILEAAMAIPSQGVQS